jgi:hypothetical protein
MIDIDDIRTRIANARLMPGHRGITLNLADDAEQLIADHERLQKIVAADAEVLLTEVPHLRAQLAKYTDVVLAAREWVAADNAPITRENFDAVHERCIAASGGLRNALANLGDAST